jgi:hypothetical protein
MEPSRHASLTILHRKGVGVILLVDHQLHQQALVYSVRRGRDEEWKLTEAAGTASAAGRSPQGVQVITRGAVYS